MPELRLVAVSPDGTHLVLKAAGGAEFALPIDDRLRAAVQGDRVRMGQIEVDTQISPRDIQARIRAGATGEEVAHSAGIPLDRVRRYEGPVLAERAYVAERAQGTPLRRQNEGKGPTLGELAERRLREQSVDLDTIRWDSWRREDNRWHVELTYAVGSHDLAARWIFDNGPRALTPLDDQAQWLMNEHQEAPPAFPFVRRIAPVPEPGEESRGESADEPAQEAAPVAATSRVAEAARRARQLDDGPIPGFLEDRRRRRLNPHRERLVGTTDRQAEADGVRPGRRATVPTWDEIVFGGRRSRRPD